MKLESRVVDAFAYGFCPVSTHCRYTTAVGSRNRVRCMLLLVRHADGCGRRAPDIPSSRGAAVSRADVIRSAVLHVAATPLDLWRRLEISPASITIIAHDEGNSKLQ